MAMSIFTSMLKTFKILKLNFCFLRDVTVEPKELTLEERREITAKEKARLDRLGCTLTSRFSPRRERALKIYLHSPTSTTVASPPVDANSSLADMI